jgi:adenylylsulfate kinase
MGSPEDRNVVWSHGLVSADDRARLLGHRPATVWLTGLSGSGKSTIATSLERRLVDAGVFAYVLDGDNLRHGLNADLDFSAEGREENIRRAGEVCRILYDAGAVTITAFISPYARDRRRVRDLHPEGGFIEVFVDAPLEVCESRDVKGLYRRARAGEISDFSGVSAPYEAPENPDLRLASGEADVGPCVEQVLDLLRARSIVAVA